MTESSDRREVKARARAADPAWDNDERVVRRRQIRAQMLAAISGGQPAEISRQTGLTQNGVGGMAARNAGFPPPTITGGETGDIRRRDRIRAQVLPVRRRQ